MSGTLRVLVTPRDDNPYYDLLYSKMSSEDIKVTFSDGVTGSQTLDLAIAPLALLAARSRGYRIVHIHWLFKFILPWAGGAGPARRLMQWWLSVCLWWAHAIGLRVVWTAHDLVPHERVFFDDDKARRSLVTRCDLVIALSRGTAAALSELGARAVRVVPLGSYAERHATKLTRPEARARFGFADGDFVVAWIGKVARYKGVDLLLEAALELPEGSPVRLLVAGTGPDVDYLHHIESLAGRVGDRAVVRLARLNDDEVGAYLAGANMAAFPFREVTNSSSVLTALSLGLPVIIPDLAALNDIPDSSAVRYAPTSAPLAAVLEHSSSFDNRKIAAMGLSATEYANSVDWPHTAQQMLAAYRDLVG